MIRAMPTILVLGARNLGGAILDHFLAQGWSGAAVARSEDTLARVRDRGALAIQADASNPTDLAQAMDRTRAEHGSLDVVVNAVTARRPSPGQRWGGCPSATGALDGRRGLTAAGGQRACSFLSTGARALRESGGGTLLQATC